MKIKLISFFSLIMASAFYMTVIIINKPIPNNFSCWDKVEYVRGDKHYVVHSEYMFNNGKGKVNTSGVYSNELKKKTVKISYELYFDYYYKDNEMILISRQLSLNDDQAELLNYLVADFFIFKDRGYKMLLFKQGMDSYVFKSLGVPVSICIKRL